MMNEIECWQAILIRDRYYDGAFVYGVRTTGIYCRPSCPSRKPQRENVLFFTQPTEAEQAGFRACSRCKPALAIGVEPAVELVERVCRAIEAWEDGVPTLAALAKRFHVSPYHLQRVFKRVVGITPRQYADTCRLRRLKERLREGETVTRTIYDVGYGASSSLYEYADAQLGMTPAIYRRGGQAMHIMYTLISVPLGQLLVAATERGICSIALGDSGDQLEAEMHAEFPAATIERADAELQLWVSVLLEYLHGGQTHLDLPLDIQATAFQRRVWEALRAIPYGRTCSYQEVAQAIGQPSAARAVARACATNPVALAIPCHRVVREDGGLGGYRWGIERKRALLAQEMRLGGASRSERGTEQP